LFVLLIAVAIARHDRTCRETPAPREAKRN